MSEFKGTKGNWKIGNHFSNIVTDIKKYRPTYKEEDYKSEFNYYGGYLVCESVSKKADAQLIASAPQLLEVLQSCVHSMNQQLEHSAIKLNKNQFQKNIDIALEAIDKAIN